MYYLRLLYIRMFSYVQIQLIKKLPINIYIKKILLTSKAVVIAEKIFFTAAAIFEDKITKYLLNEIQKAGQFNLMLIFNMELIIVKWKTYILRKLIIIFDHV